MRKYWDEVVKAINLLVYIVKRFDKNGVDLHFTISTDIYHAKRAAPIVEAVKKHRPKPSSSNRTANMGAKLEDILGKYRIDLSKKFRQPLPFFKPSCKKTILFVLTDGLWQPDTNAEHPIKDLVKSLQDHEQPRNQFGLQFIQFGNDPYGTNTLRYLDDLPDTELYEPPFIFLTRTFH
jgi:hypothetical protein